jgi:hypothetical protein
MKIRTAAAAFLTLLVLGCAGQTKMVPLRQEPHLLLGYLEYSEKSDMPALDHPAKYGEAELGQALAALVFQEDNTLRSKEPRKVFLDSEITLLAPALVSLFEKAAPRQAIYFALERTSGEGVSLFARATSGQLFVLDRKLHVVIGEVQREQVEGDGLNRKAMNFGDPRRDFRKNWRLLENPWVKFVPKPGKPGQMYNNQVTVAPPPVVAAAPAPATLPAASGGASIEEKLSRLKSIYNQGLIGEEEYAAKKAEILKGL